MEEFEIDLQCLQNTTNFDKQMSHLSVYNESGNFNCNYQSPTYNSYQINNPIFNIYFYNKIFDNDFYNNRQYENNIDNHNCLPYGKEISQRNNEYTTIPKFLENYPSSYTSLGSDSNDITFVSKEHIIDMLIKKCREFIPEEYDIEIFI